MDSEGAVAPDGGQQSPTRPSRAPYESEVTDPTRTERLVGRLAVAVAIVEATLAAEGTSRFDRLADAMFADWFRARRQRFAGIRTTLNQARIEESYDSYLARGTLWLLVYSVAGGLLGAVTALVLFSGGGSVTPRVLVPEFVPTVLVDVLGVLVEPLGSLVVTIGGSLALAGPVGLYVWYRPRLAAYNRRREIQQLLPQAVTKMYALSHGDTTFPAIVRSLAEEEATYGDVARAFQAIQNDIDYFGADLRTALRDAREATPSDELGELFDDLISILDSGGALAPFLAEKTREYQQRARRRNEDLLDTLGFFAEIYVTAGVVGVLMVLVMLIVMTSISGRGYAQLWLVIYAGIPLVNVGLLVAIDAIFADDTGTARTIPDETEWVTPDQVAARLQGEPIDTTGSGDSPPRRRDPYARTTGHDEELGPLERTGLVQLQSALRRDRVLRQLRAPLVAMARRPLLSLITSLPAAVAVVVLLAVTGVSVPLPKQFLTTPIWTTTWSLVVPTMIVLVPITYFHERRQYHSRRVSRELPAMLRKLSSASETGMTLAEAISLVADSSSGYLAGEFRKVDHELSNLNVSLADALVRLANRVRHPRLTRILKLLIEANTSGGRVREVLSVAATDAELAYQLERERLGDMVLYMAIILLGNLIFLVISLVLLTQLLPALSTAAESVQSLDAQRTGSQAVPGLADAVRVPELTLLLYHGALLQSLFTGFLAGKLSYDDAWSGSKFAVAQLIVTVAAFVLA